MALNGTMVKIETVTVGSGGQAAIEFTNIPQTYDDIVVQFSARGDNASISSGLRYTLNNDTGSTKYSWRFLRGDGSAAGSQNAAAGTIGYLYAGEMSAASSTSSTFGQGSVYFPNYRASQNKSSSVDAVSENNATTAYTVLAANLWADTSAITSIKFTLSAGNFAQYSTATLYGISRTTAQIKATGGTVYDDANYVYHLFTSSGVFTPLQDLTVDYLVVAGGGGSGGGTSGGGGAGGVRSTVTSTGGGGALESALSLNANTSYTVTIGAGGAAGPTDGTNGSAGANTVFATITATGGGFGAHGGTGGSGGSGGGAGYGTNTGGAASPSGQGYAGGNTTSTTSPYFTGAGGGGAGAAGGSVNASYTGGSGGIGIWTALTNAVQVGQLSSSNYYVGGGGAGGNASGTVNGGIGGGGASIDNQNGVAGTANTGGGAGGSGTNEANSGGTGGSGIVIVRYTK